MDKPMKLYATLTIQLTEWEVRQLEAMAKTIGLTPGRLVKQLVRKYLGDSPISS